MLNMTKKRKMILDLFKDSQELKSAEDIYDQLDKKTMNLSTVYRTLDLFYSHGLVSKSFINNKAFYYLTKSKHAHYMICIKCHTNFEIDCHLDHTIDHLEQDHHFKVLNHDLTFYGICEKCQKTNLQ